MVQTLQTSAFLSIEGALRTYLAILQINKRVQQYLQASISEKGWLKTHVSHDDIDEEGMIEEANHLASV